MIGCKSVAVAIQNYRECSANSKREDPRTLDDLVNPPFGGAPFLRNGEDDLLDPWGKRYQIEHTHQSDGVVIILVKTTAPDGTPISQFGIGNASKVK